MQKFAKISLQNIFFPFKYSSKRQSLTVKDFELLQNLCFIVDL